MAGISQYTPQTGRILPVDFWRGAYLLMIYINHVPGQFWAKITLWNWGFSDSAEAFVFLSGFSAMLAFQRYYIKGGPTVGFLRVAKRVWQLFCAHILLVVAMAALLVGAGTWTDSAPLIQRYNFTPLLSDTNEALIRLFTLRYLPNLGDILPLYVVLIALFPVIWFLLRLSPWLVLGVSFSVWLGVNLTKHGMPNYPEGMRWFFNPLAWQFLFVVGVLAAYAKDGLVRFARRPVVFGVAVVYLLASMIAVAPWMNFFPEWGRIVPASYLSWDYKSNLSPVRLLHMAALAIVAVWLMPHAGHAFWKNKMVGLLNLCGRHSLVVYVSGTLFSLTAIMIIQHFALKGFGAGAVVFVGALLLVSIPWALDKTQKRLKLT